MKCIVIGLLSIFSPFFQVSAQPNIIHFDNFNSSNGLISEFINNIYRDSKGYIWLAANGLIKFDGKHYVRYTNFNNDNNSLRNNYTDNLLEDPYGRLWVGAGGGICYYDYKKDKFFFPTMPDGSELKYGFSLVIKGNVLWFVCDAGLCHMDLSTLRIEKTGLTYLPNPVFSHFLNATQLWVHSSSDGEYIYNPADNTFTNFFLHQGGHKIIITDAVGVNGKTWIASTRGLYSCNGNVKDLAFYPKTEKVSITSLTLLPQVTGDTVLWLGTNDKGLGLFSLHTRTIKEFYQFDELDPYSIGSNSITSMFPDRNGMLWLGTAASGISLFNPENQKLFTKKLLRDGAANTDNYILGMKQDLFDNNVMWIAYQNKAIIKMGWKTGKVIKSYGFPRGPYSSFFDLTELDKTHWLIASKNIIYKWNTATNKKNVFTSTEPTDGIHYEYIIPKNRKEGYITSNKGLYKYDCTLNTIQKLPLTEYLLKGIYDSANHALWIGSTAGLHKYDEQKKQYTVYQPVFSKNYKGDNYIFDLIYSPVNKKIYCATGMGIAIFDMVTDSFDIYSTLGDVYRPSCLAIALFGENLFISSNAGMFILNLRDRNVYRRKLSGSDDYTIRPFSIIDSSIIVGMRNSFTTINVNSFLKEPLPTTPIIESIHVNHELIIAEGKEMEFTHTQNDVAFIFTAFNFASSTIRFRYKLNGWDKEWNSTSNERSASYANLAPGHYRFSVQSGNNNGVWNQQASTFSFYIVPPFWSTWWFILILVLFCCALVAGFIAYRIHSIRKKEAVKTQAATEVAEMEIKVLRSQMNPHFIFNSLNSIQKFIWENKQEDATEYLAKLGRLMRMILENSMHKWITLESEIKTLSLYLELEHRRCNNKFDYSISVTDAINAELTLVPPLLIQPFAENAIWHGLLNKPDRGKLEITIANGEDEMLLCTVEDNGIGRQEAERMKQLSGREGASYGVEITSKRLAFQSGTKKGRLEIADKMENRIATGTKVTLYIPITTFIKV